MMYEISVGFLYISLRKGWIRCHLRIFKVVSSLCDTTAALYDVTEKKAEIFFTLYCFVIKQTSGQQIQPQRFFFFSMRL